MTNTSRHRMALASVLALALVAIGAWIATSDRDGAPADAAGASDAASSPTAGSTPGSTPEATATTAPGETGTPEATATDDAAPPKTTGKQPDTGAPTEIGPAERPGVELDPDLRVAERSFEKTASYPDGLKVRIAGIENRRVRAMGPGAVSGPVTVFRLEVTNATGAPIELGTVVVSAVYGPAPGLLADPSYDVPVRDLVGTLRPGSTTKASYAFAVPSADLGSVTLHVDLDGTRLPAVFTGSARS